MAALIFIVIMLLASAESQADIYKYVSDDGTVIFTDTPIDKSGKVVSRERKKSYPSNKISGKPYVANVRYHAMAEERAAAHNVDPRLIKAVIKAESNWNPNAVSPKGARGLMQLMPSTASILGVRNSLDPEDNIDGGIRYLKYLLNKFGGNLTLALAAYNAGPKLVERIRTVPSIPETVTYVNRVINYYSGNNFVPVQGDFSGIKKQGRIQKMVLKDGTVLFTNSYLSNLYFDQGF